VLRVDLGAASPHHVNAHWLAASQPEFSGPNWPCRSGFQARPSSLHDKIISQKEDEEDKDRDNDKDVFTGTYCITRVNVS
jgi:hypothetical protein